MRKLVALVGVTVLFALEGCTATATITDPIQAWRDEQFRTCGPAWHTLLSAQPPKVQEWLLRPPMVSERTYETNDLHDGDDLYIQVRSESLLADCGLNPEGKDIWLRRNTVVLRWLNTNAEIVNVTWYSGEVVGFLWIRDTDGYPAIVFRVRHYGDWYTQGEDCFLRQFILRFRPPTAEPLKQ